MTLKNNKNRISWSILLGITFLRCSLLFGEPAAPVPVDPTIATREAKYGWKLAMANRWQENRIEYYIPENHVLENWTTMISRARVYEPQGVQAIVQRLSNGGKILWKEEINGLLYYGLQKASDQRYEVGEITQRGAMVDMLVIEDTHALSQSEGRKRINEIYEEIPLMEQRMNEPMNRDTLDAEATQLAYEFANISSLAMNMGLYTRGIILLNEAAKIDSNNVEIQMRLACITLRANLSSNPKPPMEVRHNIMKEAVRLLDMANDQLLRKEWTTIPKMANIMRMAGDLTRIYLEALSQERKDVEDTLSTALIAPDLEFDYQWDAMNTAKLKAVVPNP